VSGQVEELRQYLARSFAVASEAEWKSFDPFDVLASPLLSKLQRLSPFAARAAVKCGKLAGARLRRALGVPLHAEPKALADFLESAVRLVHLGETWAEEFASSLVAELRQRATPVGAAQGWGLGFPYTSRFVNVDAGVPNAYTTIVASDALLSAGAVLESTASTAAALGGCAYLTDVLGTFRHDGQWLRYWPHSTDRIVNIQASAAALFARAGSVSAENRMLELADEAAASVLAAQRDDGSWPYSMETKGHFVDGFHTGFTLTGLAAYACARGPGRVASAETAVRRGFAYFQEHLLSRDGLPLGFADGAVDLSGQNAAQCVLTHLVCASGPRSVERATTVWRAAFRQQPAPRRFLDLRWTLGPACVAASALLEAVSAPPGGGG
jgi:hypothetical protein